MIQTGARPPSAPSLSSSRTGVGPPPSSTRGSSRADRGPLKRRLAASTELTAFAEPGPTWKASGLGLDGTSSGFPFAVISASPLPRPSWKPAALNGPWSSPAARIWPFTRRLPERSTRQTQTVPVGLISIEAFVGSGGGFGGWSGCADGACACCARLPCVPAVSLPPEPPICPMTKSTARTATTAPAATSTPREGKPAPPGTAGDGSALLGGRGVARRPPSVGTPRRGRRRRGRGRRRRSGGTRARTPAPGGRSSPRPPAPAGTGRGSWSRRRPRREPRPRSVRARRRLSPIGIAWILAPKGARRRAEGTAQPRRGRARAARRAGIAPSARAVRSRSESRSSSKRSDSATQTTSAISRRSSSTRPRVVSAGVPIRRPEGFIGGRSSNGIALRLTVIPTSSRRLSAVLPSRPVEPRSTSTRWTSVPPVSTSTPPAIEPLGEGLRVGDRLALAGAELLRLSEAERHRLGGDHVHEGAALLPGEHGAVDVLLELLGAQDHPAARPAEGLVDRRRDHVGVRAPGSDARPRRRGRRSEPCRP